MHWMVEASANCSVGFAAIIAVKSCFETSGNPPAADFRQLGWSGEEQLFGHLTADLCTESSW